MPISINYDAETTEIDLNTDVFEDALKALRISGCVLLREVYASPWAVAVPDSKNIAALLKAEKSVRVIAFHLVEFGHCLIETQGGEAHHLKAGEMIVCFGGEAHQLRQGEVSNVQSIETLLAGQTNSQRPDSSHSVEQTALLCGAFQLTHTEFNPLFSALPSVMRANLSRTGTFSNLSGVARLMAEEIDRHSPGSGYVIERLLEILCAEAIRSHVEHLSRNETNWFCGISDPIIGKALAIIHQRPGDDWSVQRLAEHVTMSPSRFAARFAESLGDSPMAYLTKWRINLACRELFSNKHHINQIAESVGYESPAAFSRAFKKHLGESPAAWRARMTT